MYSFIAKLSRFVGKSFKELNRRTEEFSFSSFRLCSTYNMAKNELSYSKGSTFPAPSPGTLRLYSMRFCPYAQRTRLVLEYKKIPHETVNVNLKLKPDWFLARNPLGLVPVLEHNGKVVYESRVCGEYLEDMYPNPPLYPRDTYLRARDKILEEVFAKLTDAWYRLLRTRGSDEKVGKRFFRAVQIYEDALGERGDFFGGSGPCMVDFTVWPWFERNSALELIAPSYSVTRARFPNLWRWMDRMMARPEVKLTMFDTQTHLQFLHSLGQGNPQYDIGLIQAQSRL